MAHSTRPQLASAPKMAALSRVLLMTALATSLAAAVLLAPVTSHTSSLVAPSPSLAMMAHSFSHTL